MLYFFLIFLVLTDFLFFFFQIKSKILIFINFLLIWLIISGYYSGVDIDNYIIDYNYINFDWYTSFAKDDLGYYNLALFFNSLNYNFFQFKMIVTGFSLLILHVGLKKLCSNEIMVLGCYLCYQVLLDTIQYRNFIGSCLIPLAMSFLFKKTKKDKIISAFLILIASSFHKVMIVYLLFLVDSNNKYGKLIRNSFVFFGIFLTISTFFNKTRIPFIDQILKMVSSGTTDNIMAYTKGSFGNSISFILPIGSLIFCILFFKNARSEQSNGIDYQILNINKLSTIYIPLFLMSFQWYRIVRNLNILNYVGFEYVLYKLKIYSKKRLVLIFFLLFILFFWFYSDVIKFIGLENIKTIFENNLFFD